MPFLPKCSATVHYLRCPNPWFALHVVRISSTIRGSEEESHVRKHFAQVKPGQIDECLRIWNESIRPALTALPGYVVAYVLVDRASHDVMTVAIYESEADAERTRRSGKYQELVAHLAPVMVPGSLQRRGYDVGIEAKRA